MTITTTTEFSNPVNVVLQRDFLMNAKARCPYFVGSNPASIREHSGTFTAKWIRVENRTPTTTALSELSGTLSLPTRAGTQSSRTEFTATLQKYGDVEVLTEEVSLTFPRALERKLMEVHSIQAGRSLNRLQRNELEDNVTLTYSGGATQDSEVASAITKNDIKYTTNQLSRNDAMEFAPMTTGSQNVGTGPIHDAFWGLCHEDVREDIEDLDGFKPVETYAGQIRTAPGEFGYVNRVRWVSSSEASIDTDSGGAPGGTLRSTSGASADLYTSVVFGREFHGSVGLGTRHIREIYKAGDELPGIQLISKGKGKLGGDPLDELATFAWKTWHAAELLNTSWGYGIRSGASRLQ